MFNLVSPCSFCASEGIYAKHAACIGLPQPVDAAFFGLDEEVLQSPLFAITPACSAKFECLSSLCFSLFFSCLLLWHLSFVLGRLHDSRWSLRKRFKWIQCSVSSPSCNVCGHGWMTPSFLEAKLPSWICVQFFFVTVKFFVKHSIYVYIYNYIYIYIFDNNISLIPLMV